MRTARAVVVLSLTLLWLGAAAAPARAHAELVASTPSELQILDGPPDRVVLAFDSSISLAFSSIQVTGASTGPLQHDDDAPTTLAVALRGQVRAGDHVVAWRGVSLDDGHPTVGSFSFRTLQDGRVSARAEIVGSSAPATPSGVPYGVARWVSFVAFSCLLGSALLLAKTRRLAALALWSWGALVLGTAATFLLYGSYASGRPVTASLGQTLSSRVGAALLVRVLLLSGMLAVVSALRGRRPLRPRTAQVAVLLSGLTLALTWSAVSHSAEEPEPFLVVDAVHLVATGTWLGGLVALSAVVLRDRGPQAVAVAQHFSRLAVVAVLVMVTTGFVAAYRRVGSLTALGDNRYGELLLLKAGLVLVLLVLAGFARQRLQCIDAHAVLRRLVATEAALGALVLAVTSVLVTTEPPRPDAPAAVLAAASQPTRLSGEVPYAAGTEKGAVQLEVLSTRPGPTELHLTIISTQGQLQPLRRISVALRPLGPGTKAIPVELAELVPGHYVSKGARLPGVGQWQLGMALQLPSGATALAYAGIAVR